MCLGALPHKTSTIPAQQFIAGSSVGHHSQVVVEEAIYHVLTRGSSILLTIEFSLFTMLDRGQIVRALGHNEAPAALAGSGGIKI